MIGRAPTLAIVLAALVGGCTLDAFEPMVGVDAGERRDAGGDAGPPGGGEICDNGIDDDDDGDVDCADADCGAYACVPLPAGAIALGELSDSCDREEVLAAPTDLESPDLMCGECACGAPTAQRCTAELRGHRLDGCSGISPVARPAEGTCDNFSSAVEAVEVVSLGATATCGAGTSVGPDVVGRPDARGLAPVTVCALPTAGCDAGQVCAPAAAPVCAVFDGEVECPPERPVRRVAITATEDLRGCSPCACRPGGGSCAAAILEVYDTDTCTGPMQELAERGRCEDTPLVRSASIRGGTATGVSCQAAPRATDGCAAPRTRQTVCCARSAGPACPVGRGPAMILVTPPSGSPFCVDATEVTNAQYRDFLAAATTPPACPVPNATLEPDEWPRPAVEDDLPVDRVDWCDAAAFCAWAGKRLCGALGGGSTAGDRDAERDPMRSEWSYACTAGGTRLSFCPSDGDAPAGSRDCCEVMGIHDLAGGVEEWVASCDASGDCLAHEGTSCSNMGSNAVDDTWRELGFRCCADPS